LRSKKLEMVIQEYENQVRCSTARSVMIKLA
jgi:hypothetical protein